MKGLLISITISFIFCYINAESAGQFNNLIKGGPSNDAFCATSQCTVGFQIINTTSNNVTNAAFALNLPKDSSCLSANFVTGGSNITLFAAEAYGLCNSTALNATGLSYGVQYSCCNCPPSVNCNAAPYNITPVASTSPNPTACYEGIWVNGTVALKDNEFGPSVCYGKCSRLSTNLNGTTIDLFTCSPENLCKVLGFTDANPCGTAGQVSGCCCSGNYCLDPNSGVFSPNTTQSPTTTPSTTMTSTTMTPSTTMTSTTITPPSTMTPTTMTPSTTMTSTTMTPSSTMTPPSTMTPTTMTPSTTTTTKGAPSLTVPVFTLIFVFVSSLSAFKKL